jgi:hypothetical protein
VHSIGNSGHVVLYLLLARLWYLHRRGRVPWARITSADPLVRPLLVWCVVPVTIWLASPYPNHIRDVANLVINRPLGESSVGAGAAIYLDALRTTYFYREWVLMAVVAAFVVAAARYRRQPPVMQWIILAIPLQSAAIALHQTRFPRFLLLTGAVGSCCRGEPGEGWEPHVSARCGWPAGAIALGASESAARIAVTQNGSPDAFENYTDNDALRGAGFDPRRDQADDRPAIVGLG